MMRGFRVDGEYVMLCPIKDCHSVLNKKNLCRHFKKSHPATYSSASEGLKFKKRYVPIKKYFNVIKDFGDEEASQRIQKYGVNLL